MRVWAAECRKCKTLSSVRQSRTTPAKIEQVKPDEEIFKHPCPHCGEISNFRGHELQEVDALEIPFPERFAG
jgi:predicted RNA-binding Zn-ribbon protein involved in translation (DUF1610 family)